jgi:PASTA domain
VTHRSIRWALKLHPHTWRDRYQEEVGELSEQLIESDGTSLLRIVYGLFVSANREWTRAAIRRPRRVAIGAAVVLIVVGGTVAGLDLSTAQTPQNQPSVGGPISVAHGKVNAPDYVAVIGQGKVAGYVASAYLFPSAPNDSHVGQVAPVYARDLHTLVGHEYPGVGFVPLGVSWTSLPCTMGGTMSSSENGQIQTTRIACPSTIETVPNIVGVVTPTAMGLLSSRSLTASIRYVHSRSIAAGHIVSVAPTPGSKVHARSTLTVESSLGPQ